MTNLLDFMVTPDDAELWMGALIHAVHGANCASESNLTIDFPDWEPSFTDKRGKTLREVNPGLRLRIRGSATALEAFAKSAIPTKFQRTGIVEVSRIQECGSEEALHCFVRDRTGERHTTGEQARRARRRERRGSNTAVAGNIRLAVREAVVFDVASSSHGVRFPLRIARIEDAPLAPLVGHSTYGLAIFEVLPSAPA